MNDLYYSLETNTRLDIFLANNYKDYSRAYLATLINNNDIKVNDHAVKVSYKLKSGDKISFNNDFLNQKTIADINLPIIYQDQYCIIIDKPSGILTHSKGQLNLEPTVASFISNKIDTSLVGNRAGIVHRLDRGTSGIILSAKSAYAVKYFQNQFAKRLIEKRYLAIVAGRPKQDEAIIYMPIIRDPKYPARFTVNNHGKPAETKFKLLATNDKYSLLLLSPKTGRTHQLRVHLQAINLPIVGDNFYNGEPADRLMLHAYSLSVNIPDKGKCKFTAPLDKSFNQYLDLDNISYD